MPVLGKVYDKILLKRTETWFTNSQNELQGANRRHCSSLHTSLVLQESVSDNVKHGKTVYVSLLDTQKAFDTVWQAGLFHKLKELHIDPKLWRILKNTYDDFQCAVSVGGSLSAWFTPGQGIHQGDILSMRLYGVFINQLLDELQSSGVGLHIDGINVSCPGFADDVAITTVNRTNMNKQLELAHQYSCRWRFKFNPGKTVVIVCGTDKDTDIDVKLHNTVLTKIECANHVGVPLCSSRHAENEYVAKRISSCRRTFYALKAVASNNFDVATLSRLYWSVCIPKLLYGVETWEPSKNSALLMEKLHCEVGKCIQGLPRLTARPVCHALLGWLPISCHIDIRRLVFLLTLIRLPYWTVASKLTLRSLSEQRCSEGIPFKTCSPLGKMYATVCKYGLIEAVHQMLDTGMVLPKIAWKRIVKEAVHSHYYTEWMITCTLYSSLQLFLQTVDKVRLSIWWTVGRHNPASRKQCKVVIKLLTGNHALGAGRRRHVVNSSLCQLCNTYEQESVSHMLYRCPGLLEERVRETPRLLDSLPGVLSREIQGMSDDEKTVFLLSGLRSDYIVEWNDSFLAVAHFVSCMYHARENRHTFLSM